MSQVIAKLIDMSDFTALDRTAASQYGLLTRQQLLASGTSRRQIDRQLASGRIKTVHREVYRVLGAPDHWKHRLSAAVLAAQPLGAASLRSASRLWGLRTFDTELEVSIRYPRKLKLSSTIVHRSVDLVPADITWVDGIAVTTPVRTICDLGLIFPEHEVARIARHAVATGFVDRTDLRAIRVRNSRQGRNGVGVLDRVLATLPLCAEQTESGPEALFLQVCERFGLPMPTPQHEISVGHHRYRVDFAFLKQKVFIEIDGVDYHSLNEQIANDDGRQNALVSAGWTPIRFTSAQLRADPAAIARLLRRILNL